MSRAGDACCDMLVRCTAMFAEQVSVEMGCSLLDEGAGSRGKNLQREKKMWRGAKEHCGCNG